MDTPFPMRLRKAQRKEIDRISADTGEAVTAIVRTLIDEALAARDSEMLCDQFCNPGKDREFPVEPSEAVQ